MKKFYKNLFAPREELRQKILPEEFELFRKATAFEKKSRKSIEVKHTITFEQFHGFLNSKQILKDNSIVKLKHTIALDELKTYKNSNQIDDRNFLALRVFSKKWEEDMASHSLEKEAMSGDIKLAPEVYTTFLPKSSSCTYKWE